MTYGRETLPKPRLELSKEEIISIVCEALVSGNAKEFWTDGRSDLFDLTVEKHMLVVTQDGYDTFDISRIYPIFADDDDEAEEFNTMVDCPVPGVSNARNIAYYKRSNPNAVLVWKEGTWLYDN